MLAVISEYKQQALDKMLKEMNEKHTSAEDAIHNWLCDQDDDELMQGILKEDRTIKGAVKYCASKAHKMKDGNVAMVDDQTVFKWVREYFTKKTVKKQKVNATVATSTSKPKKENKSKKKEEPVQMSLYDFL